MIQGLEKNMAFSAPRRVWLVLLVALLNLALVPCTMALEVREEGHDCCPPELNLELLQCCELDDVSVDRRDGLLELWDTADYDDVAMVPMSEFVAWIPVIHSSATDPPGPPDRVEDLQKLLCVYLK